jgi:predicted AlkP superfamily phosphohydrolase/phosphomutase
MDDSRSGSVDTLLVGLDAACPSVLDPVMDAGVVPTLEQVFDDGASAPLESQVPPWTASAWPSLYTGVNPGKHGVFGFLAFDGYDWTVVDATRVREWALWETLDRHGKSSVVVNVPVTHPPAEVDGAVVPGYVAPDDPPCHPDGVLDDLRAELGDYRVYPAVEKSASADDKTAEYRRLAAMRGRAFQYLADRFQPHFGFLQFQVTDTVLHAFPGDTERAAAVYAAVDDALADVLDACDPDTVLVASDHGMDAYSTRFRVNEFLRDRGFVVGTTGGDGMPAWSAVRDNHLRDGAGGGPGVVERAVRLAARFGVTSQRVGAVLDRLGLADVAMQVVPTDAVRAASEQVDFPESKAYVRTRTESGVRVNLQGREPDGVVPQDRYEVVRTDLVDHLSDATTSRGRRVFDEVARREEFFDGPYVHKAPDVVAVPRDFDVYLTTWLLGDHFERPDEPTWDHTMTGVFAAAGDGINPDADLADAHLFDVAPTVLASLGVPASHRMDGDPLPVVEPAGTTDYPDYDAGPVGGTDDRGVEDRLTTLGYLE